MDRHCVENKLVVCSSPRTLTPFFRIWTGCDYICSGYDDGRDAAFYMCHDRIGALVTANLTGGNALDAVLGCQVCALPGVNVVVDVTAGTFE